MGKFFVQNVRMGFANNSSSSHSFIYANNIKNEFYCSDFGWENFTLSTPELKMSYLASLIKSDISKQLGDQVSDFIIEKIIGVKATRCIDHQSLRSFPHSYNSNKIDLDFIEDMKRHLMRDDVVILGGNDNDEPHHLSDMPQDVMNEVNFDNHVCRKQNGVWTIMDKRYGHKVRISFDGEVDQEFKSETPELVDLKITNKCSFGCTYCYMGSTAKGKDSLKIDSYWIAKILGEMKVLEVAIGGGEPTQSENFVGMMQEMRKRGVTPNFTTYNLSWLKDDEKRSTYMDLCGSFAYSVRSVEDAEVFIREAERTKISGRCSAQIVMGTVKKEVFHYILSILKKSGISVTLLGFKETGFGAGHEIIEYDWWPDIVKEVFPWGVGIDTLLAKQTDMKGLGISPKTYHELEGKTSCYIDLVEGRIGPSSYSETEDILDWNKHDEWRHRHMIAEEILNKWKKY